MLGLGVLVWCAICCQVLTLASAQSEAPRVCTQADYHYEYTECDTQWGRWRVFVPKDPKTCTPGENLAQPPQRGKHCQFTCEAGQYLDVQGDQECHACPAGTYSLGGARRYEDWSTLPAEFTVESLDMAAVLERYSAKGDGKTKHEKKDDDDDDDFKGKNCTEGEGWMAIGGFMAALAGTCESELRLQVTLVRPGKVSFDYQYPSGVTMFSAKVHTAQCHATAVDNSGWLDRTDAGEWKQKELKLQAGVNVIKWVVLGLQATTSSAKPILLKRIEIDGVSYTSECSKCPAGSHSSAGAAECDPCPLNTYTAAPGVAQCKMCDAEAQYSVPGSTECKAREPCKETDYFASNGPCDDDSMSEKMYQWIDPQLCRPMAEGSVSLPPSGTKEKCPPCNPGMQLVNGTCEFCPKGTASSGAEGGKCEQCPVSTAPQRGIYVQWWHNLLDMFKPVCLSANGDNSSCKTAKGWSLQGDHISSGVGHADNAYLVLIVNVDGFSGEASHVGGMDAPVGQLSFVFETQCSGPCYFHLIQEEYHSKNPRSLMTWKGNTIKQKYTYSIGSPRKTSFMFVFEKLPLDESLGKGATRDYVNDVAKIYSFNITNTLTGGADRCKSCGEGAADDNGRCVACPPGQYKSVNSTQCFMCPPNTVINSQNAEGRNSCVACLPGLVAQDGRFCVPDGCRVNDTLGRSFDFAPLNKAMVATGEQSFMTSGAHFNHIFNISLCGSGGQGQALCVSNVSQSDDWHERGVKSHVCELTVLPSDDFENRHKALTTQPVDLASTLVTIDTHLDKDERKRLQKEGFDIKDDDIFTIFYYREHIKTTACQTGRTTLVTVVCDLNGDGIPVVPSKCPEGTCGGCDYHFLVRSPHGCPLCRRQDYTSIPHGCKFGKQVVTHVPPKNCYDPSGKAPEQFETEEECPLLSVEGYVGIAVAGLLTVGLVALVCHFWKRNKTLQYKYMRLVEESGPGGNGELPAAETCGLSETDSSAEEGDHEEFDKVEFQKPTAKSGGRRLFSKIGGARKKRGGLSFETVNLTSEKAAI